MLPIPDGEIDSEDRAQFLRLWRRKLETTIRLIESATINRELESATARPVLEPATPPRKLEPSSTIRIMEQAE